MNPKPSYRAAVFGMGGGGRITIIHGPTDAEHLGMYVHVDDIQLYYKETDQLPINYESQWCTNKTQLQCIEPVLGSLTRGQVIDCIAVVLMAMNGQPVPMALWFDQKHWAFTPLPNFIPYESP